MESAYICSIFNEYSSIAFLIRNDIYNLALDDNDFTYRLSFNLCRNCADFQCLFLHGFLITAGFRREFSTQLAVYLYDDLNDILNQLGFIIGLPWLIGNRSASAKHRTPDFLPHMRCKAGEHLGKALCVFHINAFCLIAFIDENHHL